jgi:hypothetical protein
VVREFQIVTFLQYGDSACDCGIFGSLFDQKILVSKHELYIDLSDSNGIKFNSTLFNWNANNVRICDRNI